MSPDNPALGAVQQLLQCGAFIAQIQHLTSTISQHQAR